MKPFEFDPLRPEALNTAKTTPDATEDFFAAMVAAVENKRRRQQENAQFAQLEAPCPGVADISEALHYLEANKPFK